MRLHTRPFDKLLVANRGEIAVRVMRSARSLGYGTVAVYSEADADAPHVRLADEAVCIGSPAPAQSYLNLEAVLEAARRTGADALHPGYGFLAENPALAEGCYEAGLVFVGPPAAAIAAMGDKAAAKAQMMEAGVPVIPGYQGRDQSLETLTAQAAEMGYPLLIKAAAGGGGRGMRVARSADELAQLVHSARAEAEGAFGSGALLLERLLERARHVEVQVFADSHGNVVHLGERECSAQRRHQKIVEESPSPAVDPELRQRMGQAAVAAARAIGYVNAGTVELMLAPEGEFYFLEMNTRLQVEHPVTELVTGQDLVRWQLLVAAGERLPLSQEQIELRGHAMEARLYAEDPAAGFLPQAGAVLELVHPRGDGVRVDAGVSAGQQISAHYDPMVAKIIAHGPEREVARRRLLRALEQTALLGPTTNRGFLLQLLRDPQLVAGEIRTDTIDQRLAAGEVRREPPPAAMLALGAVLCGPQVGAEPWSSSGQVGWSVALDHGEGAVRLDVRYLGQQRYTVQQLEREGGAVELQLLWREGSEVRFVADGVQQSARAVEDGARLHLALGAHDICLVQPEVPRQLQRAGAAERLLRAPMAGKVLAVEVEQGAEVSPGQRVVVLEAMKMEHRVEARGAARVLRVAVAVGDQVSARDVLVELEPAPGDETQADEETKQSKEARHG